MITSIFSQGLISCGKIKSIYQDEANNGMNSCCSVIEETTRPDVEDVCDVTEPGESMTGWTKAGYTSYGLLRPEIFSYNGHLQWQTWNMNEGELTHTPTYARLPDLPSCGTLPLNNEFFHIEKTQQLRLVDGNIVVKSRINGKWYNFPDSISTSGDSSTPEALENIKNSDVGVMLSDPWKVARGDVTASSSIVKDGTFRTWPNGALFSTNPDNQVYSMAKAPSRNFFHYGMTASIYDTDCKRFRFNGAGKTGILGNKDWYINQSAEYYKLEAERTLQMNKVYRDYVGGRIGLLENVKEFSREYFTDVITEEKEVLMSPHSGDGDGNYGVHVNSAYADGKKVDGGFGLEWYGPFYDYPHKWFHNGKEYGSSAVVPRFRNIYRFKPTEDGKMHDPLVRVDSNHSRVSVFNDAFTFIDGAWGNTIVDVDGYVYPRDFSFNGGLAQYYSHRFEKSRNPMVSGGGGDKVIGETFVGYVPPGDYLRPMVKKTPSGTKSYIKVTGTLQSVKDRAYFSYNTNNYMLLDDDGYVYMTGMGSGYSNERLMELKKMYPDDFVDVIVDNGVVDSETFADRNDFAEDIHDVIMSNDYYNGDLKQNAKKRHGTVTSIVPSNGVPTAAKLMMYEDDKVLSLHHRIIGPNYALPVKVRINGEGDRVYLNANEYSVVHESKNICDGGNSDCRKVMRGAVFHKKDGTVWHWDFLEGFDIFQMSVNGQTVPRSSSNPPTPENPIKPSHVVTTMYEGVIANVGVSCRDFSSACAVDSSVPFTPSVPTPLYDFCSKNSDGKTPCKYGTYDMEEKGDRSMTCYGFLYEQLRNRDNGGFKPFTEEAKANACSSDREDQLVDYTNQNLVESAYDTSTFPKDKVLRFADACKLTCAKYNTPLITLENARTMVLDMKGATSFTLKGSEVPKLRKLTLVNTEKLTKLILDGVMLRTLEIPMTENLALSNQGKSAIAYLKLSGKGSVSVNFINALDGLDGRTTDSDTSSLPVGTPLLKGAMRYIDLGDTITVSGDISTMKLLQLYKFRARSISTLNLATLIQGCPKLVDLDVDISPTKVSELSTLGSFSAHFKQSYTFISNGNTYPNRQIKLGPLSDLSTITNVLSGKSVTYLRVDDITAGNGGNLASLKPTVRSIRLSGAISGNVDISRFTNLETLSISSTSSLTLDLDQSFGHKSCASLKTIQLLGTTSNGWTGSLTSLNCYNLNVLQIKGPSLVTGTFKNIKLGELRSLAVASVAVTGTLDDLAAAHNLHHLDVTGNVVSGETSSLRHLSNLNHLTLNGKIENKEDLKTACGTITVVPHT